MRPRFKVILTSVVGVLVIAAAAVAAPVWWSQWGRDPLHQGFVPVAGQTGSRILANIVYDPFTDKEQNGPTQAATCSSTTRRR